jgi:hypothetical protein
MSRLYYRSRIVVLPIEKICVATRGAGRGMRSRVAMQFDSASIFAVYRVQQRRVPQPPSLRVAGPNHSACRNKLRHSRVNFQAQYQAFVRFAVASSAALFKPSRSITTCLLEPFTRTGSRRQDPAIRISPREFWPSPVASTGPATLDRRCGRNVVVPGGYSKLFFAMATGLYEGKYRPKTARRTPARSSFGVPASSSPARVNSASTSVL